MFGSKVDGSALVNRFPVETVWIERLAQFGAALEYLKRRVLVAVFQVPAKLARRAAHGEVS